MQKLSHFIGVCLAILSISCHQDFEGFDCIESGFELKLQGHIEQEYTSRADDNGFANGDVMGIYIVDYNNDEAGAITDPELRASNILYTYDATVNSWSTSGNIYWKDTYTPVDIYGYYPGVNNITSPDKYKFEISDKQNSFSDNSQMSNYEASDFLWGKVEKVTPTENTIVVRLGHRMAGVNVQLIKGQGITASEWESMQKIVQVDNTIRHAYINMSEGVPVPYGDVDKSIVMFEQSDNNYRAVVIPQTVPAGESLLSVTIEGRTYSHSLTSDMVYNMGKLHNFTLTLNRTEASGDFECNIGYEGVTDWKNDENSHSYESNSYVVIDVQTPGYLEQKISEMEIDPAGIKNLKLTGYYNEKDFEYIRRTMSESLVRINLEKIKLVDVSVHTFDYNIEEWVDRRCDDYLPNRCFSEMHYLRHVILPSNLKEVGSEAFKHCEFTYPLIIPEGVTHLHSWSCECNAEIVLPHTLEFVGEYAFYGRQARGELVMTDNLRYLQRCAFHQARFTGTFYLSPNIEYIGDCAFEDCGDRLSGDIVIPPSMTEIPGGTFLCLNFANGTNLYLHDGVTRIGDSAFASIKIKNTIRWPNRLKFIDKNAFWECGMVIDNLQLPPSIKLIGQGAFWQNNILGELVLPEHLEIVSHGAYGRSQITSLVVGDSYIHIGPDAFAGCSRLQKVYLGKNVDYIDTSVFSECHSLQTIICMAEEPPIIRDNTFEGVDYEKCIVQVPEKSVGIYRNTNYWKQFKNITAYKELAFNIPEIVSMDKGSVSEGVIRAEGAWEVIECPSWVTISPSSGQGKAVVSVTVDSQSVGASTRDGKIVFSLKDYDYTTSTTIRQIGYEYGEDSTVVLQEASAGAAKAIPLFIVGDGYNAADIASGRYLDDIKQQMEHFFSIEPLKSYRDYFTVSTAYAVSPESGIDGRTKFDSENYNGLHGNDDKVLDYARNYGVGISGNESCSTILVLLNTNATANSSSLRDDGLAISYMGKSEDVYPYDQRGCVLHEFAGAAFGKLGPETINHLTFIEACGCPGCNMNEQFNRAIRNGWWQNISKTNKQKQLPWYHLIFHEKYTSIVDIYEGACNHARGVYRSENQSVMGNAYIHYFNTISREILVRRIMECAGKEFVFDDFVANDKVELPE